MITYRLLHDSDFWTRVVSNSDQTDTMVRLELMQSVPTSLTRSQAIWLVIILVTVRVFYTIIYRIWFHPLARYPGPLFAKLSTFYMIAQAVECRETYTRHDLFQKYGNVVRTGPNELCFADIASIKDIYGQSAEPCLKNSFYDGFTLTGGTHSVFSSTNRAAHAQMRRLLSNGLSERGVLRVQDELKVMIERYLAIILQQSQVHLSDEGENHGTTVIELHDLTHNLYRDIISLLSFGKSFDILATGCKNQGAEDIETYFSICPLYGTFPLARYLPFGIFRAAREAQPRIIKFVQSCIDDYRDRLEQDKDKGATLSHEGLLRLMLEAKDEETGTMFSDEELIENAVIFILAGSGTTASTLLYLIYELGKRPRMQQRLEKEIRDAFPDPAIFPDYDTATQLVSDRLVS